MKNTVTIAGAVALIAVSGLVHGTWTNRWRAAPELKSLATRFQSVPRQIGDWTATSRSLPPREMAIAGAVGEALHVYTNSAANQSISVMLLCGLPGNISAHTPDACYPGAGYSLGESQRYVQSYGDPPRVAEFQTAVATRTGVNPSRLRIYWTWHGSSGWSAPENPRWAFAAEPMLTKLYVVRQTGAVQDDPSADPCAAFLSLLLPEVDRLINPSTRTERAGPDDVPR